MCLTIPKKVIEIRDEGIIVVEDMDGNRQELRTILNVNIGEFVISKQNIAIEKIEEDSYKEMMDVFKSVETRRY